MKCLLTFMNMPEGNSLNSIMTSLYGMTSHGLIGQTADLHLVRTACNGSCRNKHYIDLDGEAACRSNGTVY